MKKMTEYQCKVVEENLEIVDRVIRYKIKINGQVLQTYEDFYQIGCEALCKAAMSYEPEQGPFYPLGSRYVFNAIIDHCRKQNKDSTFYADLVDENGDNDFLIDSVPVEDNFDDMIYRQEVWTAFNKCKEKYTGIVLRGIEALELKSLGYTTREIADRYNTTINSVNAWISRARVNLKTDPDFLAAIS